MMSGLFKNLGECSKNLGELTDSYLGELVFGWVVLVPDNIPTCDPPTNPAQPPSLYAKKPLKAPLFLQARRKNLLMLYAILILSLQRRLTPRP